MATARNATSYKAFTDWRVPTLLELQTLVVDTTGPTIDTTAFPNTQSAFFWTSDVDGSNPGFAAWVVHFSSGSAGATITVNVGCSPNPVPLGGSSTCTASPITGYTFANFSACPGTVSANTCTLSNVTAPVALTANYTATQPVIATSAIFIDPATPATLYAGLDGAGVYKSLNGGASWTTATTQPTNLRTRALVIQPGDSSKLFAASYGGGVFASVNLSGNSANNGTVWAACTTQPANLNVLSLSLDAAGKLYAGTEAGIFVSSDACASWTAMNSGLPN